jgi:hypothetical protein
MACEMGRSGCEITDAMNYTGPRGSPPTHGIREASRVKSRDKDHGGSSSDPRRAQEGITNSQEAIPKGIHRDHRYIRDSYYYQR